jgi:phosphotransferase system IIB component
MPAWIEENLVLIVCGAVILSSLIYILVVLLKKKHGKKNESSLYQELVSCFGGLDNIIQVSVRESRLSLVLKDYSLVDSETLKEKGVTSSIKMSNKITFVIGSQAKDIAKYIEENLK